MATNEILRFSYVDTGSNLLTQVQYSASLDRINGNTPDTIAQARLNNKALLQLSTMSAGFAQFLADNQSTNITDQLTYAQTSAITTAAIANVIYANQGVYITNALFSGSVLDRDAVAYDSGTGRFVPALADGSPAQYVIGIADIPNSRVLMWGQISGTFITNTPPTQNLLSSDVAYYLANTGRGGVITLAPSDPNRLIRVGVARNSTTLFFQPQVEMSARSQVFTADGVFNVPRGTKQILITAVGGGGGGGGAGGSDGNGGPNVAAGGGSGGEAGRIIVKQRVIVVDNEIISITIGSGGAIGTGGAVGVAGSAGGQGGNTIVNCPSSGTIVTAVGGLGGLGSAAVNPGNQFSAGAPPAGSSGGAGFTGIGASTVDPCFGGNGGHGGSGYLSSGSSGGIGRPEGLAPGFGYSADQIHGYGGGAGGGAGRAAINAGQSGAGGSGGLGASGAVIIEW